MASKFRLMRAHILFPLMLAFISQACIEFDFNWGPVVGDYVQPVVEPDIAEGDYTGSLLYWINDQEYLPEMSKEIDYKTSITWLGEEDLVISFDSTFLYQIPALNFKISHSMLPNTIILEPDQAYTHWLPLANNHYAGHINLDTISTYNSVHYSISIKSMDQDSLRLFSISGRREL